MMCAIMLQVGCTTLDNGCHLKCGECTDLELKCDIHGQKAEGPPVPIL